MNRLHKDKLSLKIILEVSNMSSQMDDTPKIEPAKTGRASCRFCRQKIMIESIRIGIPYQFTRPDGKTITSYGYYHPECVPIERIESILDILSSTSSIGSEAMIELTKSLKKRQKEGDKTPQPQREISPFLEPSKSSRGACKICEKKMEKGTLRVAEPTQVELDDGRKFFSNSDGRATSPVTSPFIPYILTFIIFPAYL